MTNIPNILTIAGSDSSGGAGIQADLKTFSALGAFGASVITVLTAQNSRGVAAIHFPDAAFVTAQLDAVFGDMPLAAVKIGVLGNAATVRAVAQALVRYQPPLVILDPVMIAKSGDALLAANAVAMLRDELLPQIHLLTPNLPEAAVLLDTSEARDEADMRAQGSALRALGARAVLMKGGHLGGEQSPDWLIEASGASRFSTPRLALNAHGTGCTLSAAIAALAPRCNTLVEAVSQAKDYLHEALRHSPRLSVAPSDGTGVGPLHHFHRWW